MPPGSRLLVGWCRLPGWVTKVDCGAASKRGGGSWKTRSRRLWVVWDTVQGIGQLCHKWDDRPKNGTKEGPIRGRRRASGGRREIGGGWVGLEVLGTEGPRCLEDMRRTWFWMVSSPKLLGAKRLPNKTAKTETIHTRSRIYDGRVMIIRMRSSRVHRLPVIMFDTYRYV